MLFMLIRVPVSFDMAVYEFDSMKILKFSDVCVR